MYKSYKYRLLPNKQQKSSIDLIFKTLHHLRLLYIQDYEKNKEIASMNVRTLFNKYSQRSASIKECDESAVCHELISLKKEKDNVTIPRKIRCSYTTSYFDFGYYGNKRNTVTDTDVFLPKVGRVKYINSRPIIDYKLKSYNVYKNYDEKYYLTVTVYTITKNDEKQPPNIRKSIGLDYSPKNFIVDNNGVKLNCFHELKDNKEKLNKIERKLGVLKKDNDKEKYSKELKKYLKLHEKISNKRNDFLHKLSTSLIKKYDYIFVEDLDLEEMKRKHNLSLSTTDNAYAKFIRMLEYKARDNNKKLIKVGRYFPSSKKCNICGYIFNNLTLDMRTWICPQCGVSLDRDVNSAINIRNKGIEMVTSSHRADGMWL